MRLFFILCIALLFVFFSGCSSEDGIKKEEALQEIPIVQLSLRDTSLEKTYVTNIQAVQNVELRNKVAGYLDKIYVDEGQQVKNKQLLFSINTDEYEADVSKAEAIISNAYAEAKEAEVKLNMVKLLVDKNVISPSEMDVAQAKRAALSAKIDEARSALSNAKTRLGFAHIHSPFQGIINRIPFKKGSLLTEGSLLTTVSDISTVYAYFSVAEDEYLRYLREKLAKKNNSNAKVHLNLADGSRYKFEGEIETTSSEFEQGTGSIAFRAKFPNPDKLLRHGSTGEVVLTTRVKDVILLPQKSVFEVQDKNFVFVVDKKNIIHVKSFLTKSRIAGFYIVQTGLQPGDKVVYEGTQNLSDGMKIIPKQIDIASLMNKDKSP